MTTKRKTADGPVLCEKHARQIGGKPPVWPDGDCEPRATWQGGCGQVSCDVAAGRADRIEHYLRARGRA